MTDREAVTYTSRCRQCQASFVSTKSFEDAKEIRNGHKKANHGKGRTNRPVPPDHPDHDPGDNPHGPPPKKK